MGADVVEEETGPRRCKVQVPAGGVPFIIGKANLDYSEIQGEEVEAANDFFFRKHERRWGCECASDVSDTQTIWLMTAHEAHKSAGASPLNLVWTRFAYGCVL